MVVVDWVVVVAMGAFMVLHELVILKTNSPPYLVYLYLVIAEDMSVETD